MNNIVCVKLDWVDWRWSAKEFESDWKLSSHSEVVEGSMFQVALDNDFVTCSMHSYREEAAYAMKVAQLWLLCRPKHTSECEFPGKTLPSLHIVCHTDGSLFARWQNKAAHIAIQMVFFSNWDKRCAASENTEWSTRWRVKLRSSPSNATTRNYVRIPRVERMPLTLEFNFRTEIVLFSIYISRTNSAAPI